MSYSSASAVCAAIPIGRDGAAAAARRTHIAVVAERDDVLAAIARFVEAAGLRFASASPIDAPLMVQLAQRALADTESKARLYVGEHSSLFFISGNRTLLFARRIGLGIESMVNVLTRPIRVRSGEEPVTLTEEQAREILATHGIPDRDAIVNHELELRGVQIIPALQPVLQRIVVELRQSLRFSLPEDGAGSIPIDCLGPGSRISGMAGVIAEELGTQPGETVNPEDAESSAGGESARTGQVGSVQLLADAIRDRRVLHNCAMMPKAHATARQRMKIQRWLWAGAAAALVMIALDAFRYHTAVESLTSQKATMMSHHSELEAFQHTSTVLAGALSEMSRIERRVEAELQHHIDSRAALNELSFLTPASIQLSTITFRRSEGGMTGTISGIALHDAKNQTELKQYVEQIRNSPLFEDAVLGNVQISRGHGQSGEQFEASLSLAALPRPEQIARESVTAAYAAQQTGDER